MPPPDGRLRPRLERVLPPNVPGESVRGGAEVLFGDGRHHWVRILARWTAGDQVIVQLEWHADGSTWQETYLREDGKFRNEEG